MAESLDNVRRQPVDAKTEARFRALRDRALEFISADARDHYLTTVDVVLVVSSLDAVALPTGRGQSSRVIAVPRHRCADLADFEILFVFAWDAASLLLPAKLADQQCRRWGFRTPRRCKRSRYWPCSVTVNARSPELAP